jgi:hypothetical protein
MLPEYLQVKWRKYAVLFLKYGFILFCTVCGTAAGPVGTAVGFTTGAFMTIIVCRVRNEKNWTKAIEQGSSSGIRGEPFPGALYVCALTVDCLRNSAEAALLIKNTFGTEYHADWDSLCRSAAAAVHLNSDLLVECLVHIIRKNENEFSPSMIRNIFTLLSAAEFSWNERLETELPSHYLAELLDYHYIRDQLAVAYGILGLPSDATIEQVKTMHRKLAAEYHPDSCMSGSDTFMRIQTAYELILHQQ